MAGERRREPGALEDAVMHVLWQHGVPMSAQEVREAMSEPVPAYGTAMTALDRLHRKGLVMRSGDSPRKIRFQATQTNDEHAGSSMMSALDRASDREAALLQFAGNLDSEDLALLQGALSRKGRRGRS